MESINYSFSEVGLWLPRTLEENSVTVTGDPEGSIREEGVLLTAYTQEITAWLQYCFEMLEAGDEDGILCDPFYIPQSGPISDEKVDKLIKALDVEFDIEIGSYANYHRNRSGAEDKTEWHRLSPRGRRALAEGAMMVIEKYFPQQRKEEPKPEYTEPVNTVEPFSYAPEYTD